jgi:alkanesulfonate monooxygenase SsuD/methylene tetrahydromethanopterin reductase-like flavin-dependent oxidoreductase (luciferase family)
MNYAGGVSSKQGRTARIIVQIRVHFILGSTTREERQVFAIEALAPGRLRLGIGLGNQMLIEHSYGLAQTTPLAYLQEYLEILRGVFNDGAISHHETFFNVEYTPLNAAVRTMPQSASVPLLTSAIGLKAFRLAGEIADGTISWACPIPYLLESALPQLRAGAEERGRPVPPIIAHVRVALSTDEEKGRAKMRQGIQFAVRFRSFTRMWAAAGFQRANEVYRWILRRSSCLPCCSAF